MGLLVMDEAHYLRNPESMTARLGRLVKAVAQHMVLLSATPIHLRNEDLFHLVNLLDEDTGPYSSLRGRRTTWTKHYPTQGGASSPT